MQGEAIHGEHFLEIDLGSSEYIVRKIVIDWEKAFSNMWTVQIKADDSPDSPWTNIATSGQAMISLKNDKHIIHDLLFEKPSTVEESGEARADVDLVAKPGQTVISMPAEVRLSGVRLVKLLIHRPAFHWGSSVWRFQVWGYPR
jgi:hypothetical protein